MIKECSRYYEEDIVGTLVDLVYDNDDQYKEIQAI
jgi:hypothetical protein